MAGAATSTRSARAGRRGTRALSVIAGILACAAWSSPAAAEPSFCGEAPSKGPSRSVGRPASGRLEGAARLAGEHVRLLPRRHAARCLDFGTARLVEALARAGAHVARTHPGSPPLGVGNLSRARGGSIAPYSRSHQSGRDADLAFYRLDRRGRPVAAEDLDAFDDRGRGPGGTTFDAVRGFTLVEALVTDPAIDVRWIFVSRPLRALLLAEGRRRGAPEAVLRRAAAALHQPSDAPPHADHFHLRIRCAAGERGCR